MKALLLLLLTAATSSAYQHFEARQRRPLGLTPDGTHLLALHSPASSLSVFATGAGAFTPPVLVAEIPVGMEPVSVQALSDDEVWVVNEESDSVSVVSLSRRVVTATIRVGDEPADLCFAAGKAFVSCARSREVVVIDTGSKAIVTRIPVNGLMPSSMAVSTDGTRLYVASLLSGNRTTVLPSAAAPNPPAPTNPLLPAAPKTALIVPANDSRIGWTTLDNDVAEINTSTHQLLRWIGGVGTHLFALAVHPDGSLWCANSDSNNLTRFEPELRGDFVKHRLSRIALPGSTVAHHDLNPGINRATTPDPASIALALAQPTALVFSPDGTRAWTSAYNSDRIAEIDAAGGSILRRVDLRVGSAAVRGPRALLLSADGTRVFVLNKNSDTLATVAAAEGALVAEARIGSLDTLPFDHRIGRGVLLDARLSGNGTISCATCHLDADHDGLAWDLGDPGGDMVSIPSADLSIHDTLVYNRDLHPMKGPMVTQTLRGLALNDSALSTPAAAVVTKFHWRGDKPSIQSFNAVFPNLMGGTARPAAEMDKLADYLNSLLHHPNPNRNLDRSLKTNLNGANASTGRDLFIDHAKSHCMICHGFNGGTDQNLDLPGEYGRIQAIKNPPLRLVYQKASIFNPLAGQQSLSGFGFGSDGTLHLMPKTHPYSLDSLRAANLPHLTAFLLSFDTGTAPVVGYEVTVSPANAAAPSTAGDLTTMESRAAPLADGIALVATGNLAGVRRSFRWDAATQRYLADTAAEAPRTRAQLLALVVGADDALTFSGTLPARGASTGGDRDGDGIRDLDEAPPALWIGTVPGALRLRWSSYFDWYPETSTTLSGPWSPWHVAPAEEGGELGADHFLPAEPSRFFRLSRTW
jgi:YVTN family beta-propeller protein